MAAINPKVGGNITLANNAQTFTGSASDLKAAFNGGLQGTQTGNVTISDTSGNIAATTLTDITSETNGTVTAASSGITITENSTQLTAALVTAETKAVMANGDVTITDTGTVDATVLSGIGNITGGTVTATGALTITGTTAELTDALVTSSKLVVASNGSAAVIFKSGDDPSGAEVSSNQSKSRRKYYPC